MSEHIAPEAVPDWMSGHGLPASSARGVGERIFLAREGDGQGAYVERAWNLGEFVGDIPAWVAPPEHLALVLLRRGGYAVGLADRTALLKHKCGTRYVQSRTAAGGWSQQRFQRRRENQASGLVGAVGEHLARLLTDLTGEPASGAAQRWVQGLVLGGDKQLVAEARDLPALTGLSHLPFRAFHDIPDPDLKVLRRTLWRARAVEVSVKDEIAVRG